MLWRSATRGEVFLQQQSSGNLTLRVFVFPEEGCFHDLETFKLVDEKRDRETERQRDRETEKKREFIRSMRRGRRRK